MFIKNENVNFSDRVDSSQKIGTGNIKRAILIANEFKKKISKFILLKLAQIMITNRKIRF